MPRNKTEIIKVLVVGTCHVPQSALEELNEHPNSIDGTVIVDQDDYDGSVSRGFLIRWWEKEDVEVRYDMPNWLLQIINIAERYGCEWISLDPDGPTINGLLIYA